MKEEVRREKEEVRREKVEVRREKVEGGRQKVEGRRQIGFVCVQRNGVSQYRGALCRAAELRTPLDFDVSFGDMADISDVFGEADYSRMFDFSKSIVEKMNRVAAPFHRFGVREVDGVKWWGWWKVEGRSEKVEVRRQKAEGVAV